MTQTPSQSQSVLSRPVSVDGDAEATPARHEEPKPRDEEKNQDENGYQDAFGDEADAEIKYKVLSWWQAGFLMVAETVSIGILSLPSVVAALGLVPAIILLVGIGLMSTYTGYTIGQFRWAYPHVQSMADAGEVLAGAFGREFLGMGQLLLIVFIMASHLLTFTVAMNTITDHGTCSIVFGVVGLVISYLLCLPRTAAKVSYLSIGSFISVFSSVLIVMIAVGVEKPWKGKLEAAVDTNLYHAFLGVCNIVFSFSGHVAFFSFIAELKDPREYPKSLFLLQGTDTILYIVSAVVIYCYAGPNVTSPALGSASPIIGKIAYGIALPTIIIGGVVNGHVTAKYIYVRIFRGSNRMHKSDLVSVGSWVGITLATWIVAWVIAMAIPVFNNLLSLIASLFASWFTYGFSGMFWLYLNKDVLFANPRKIFLTVVNIGMVGVSAAICGLGLYVSGRALNEDSSSASFSCKSNAS
ncbi:transmembrane amino acid transporter protein-domain-containing protein [Aspergillus venezuelensis]